MLFVCQPYQYDTYRLRHDWPPLTPHLRLVLLLTEESRFTSPSVRLPGIHWDRFVLPL